MLGPAAVAEPDSSAAKRSTPTRVLIDELSPDQRAVVDKLKAWRHMFSMTGRGEVFDIDRYPQIFMPTERGDEMLTFDQYVPAWASTQIDGVDGYRTVWNRDVNDSFPGWTIEKMDVLRVEVSGDLAWSALNFWGTGIRDGETYTGAQHGTHIWHDIDPGNGRDWRIAHEHLTAITVKGEAAQRYDGRPPVPVAPAAGDVAPVDAKAGLASRAGDTAEGTFAALIDRYCDAWTSADGTLDETAIRELYAGDPQLVFIEAILPETFTGRETMIEHGRELFAGLASMTLTSTEPVKVRRRGGGVAWTTGVIRLHAIRKDGGVIDFPMRQTVVWERVGDGWKIAHEHVSAPIGTAPSGANAYTIPVDENASAFAGMAIDHACLVTADYDRLTAFYRDAFGFAFEEQWEAPDVVPGAKLCYLVHPSGVRLEIVGSPNAKMPAPPETLPGDFNVGGYRHLCLAVDDLDAAYAEAVAKGVENIAEPFNYPRLQKRLAFLRDSDGNTIELVAPMKTNN